MPDCLPGDLSFDSSQLEILLNQAEAFVIGFADIDGASFESRDVSRKGRQVLERQRAVAAACRAKIRAKTPKTARPSDSQSTST